MSERGFRHCCRRYRLFAERQHTLLLHAMSKRVGSYESTDDAEEVEDDRHQDNFPKRLAFGVWYDALVIYCIRVSIYIYAKIL